ncbi:hypothetical protein EMIHUDRAFT_222248 [Emiliania huxleyi CCMP1516]|uniref:protein xylosyltransferase n=2 Tax=Emiliania huxleyi TaxID=2903 RepID=A0A0D3KYN3_EMIH1|nr:hypothetical protein EMIHUDRAFT_222248 [Emiliania huxleyi CCMP1516]EOD40868.1 hypothetical protein EMIHUDRAFT_222248 [Emiliania huxleyi CCMP1516]|eukprot:XP_005793297.1 hypothetical protein EMIHUDRAFT_222248 [Emiliania huxleyi CCMP1516]
MQLLDHEGRNAAAQPSSAAAHAACLAAIDERLRRAAGDGMPLRARTAVQLPPPAPAGPGRASLAFLIMAHRRFAHATVARLVRALDAPSHLFLLHIDARAHSAVAGWAASEPRVHLLERRPVGWGAASQVEVLLEAVAIALAAAPSLDFVINLSDADVALRTGRELSSFLARHRGTSFVAAKFPARDGMRYGAHATMRTPAWLEPPPPQGTSFFHGSQWAVLSAEAASRLHTVSSCSRGTVWCTPQLSEH